MLYRLFIYGFRLDHITPVLFDILTPCLVVEATDREGHTDNMSKAYFDVHDPIF